LRPRVNRKSYRIRVLKLVSLHELRECVRAGGRLPGRIAVQIVVGDVRQLHAAQTDTGAFFQVASQFNPVQMVAPHVTPEDGVTRYKDDPHTGPRLCDRRRRVDYLSQLLRSARRCLGSDS
jgi:hypothetical protein